MWTLLANRIFGNMGYGAIVCQKMKAIKRTAPTTINAIT